MIQRHTHNYMRYLRIVLHFECSHVNEDEVVMMCTCHFSLEKRVEFFLLIHVYMMYVEYLPIHVYMVYVEYSISKFYTVYASLNV